jgi:hypothetical protein
VNSKTLFHLRVLNPYVFSYLPMYVHSRPELPRTMKIRVALCHDTMRPKLGPILNVLHGFVQHGTTRHDTTRHDTKMHCCKLAFMYIELPELTRGARKIKYLLILFLILGHTYWSKLRYFNKHIFKQVGKNFFLFPLFSIRGDPWCAKLYGQK